MEYLVDLGLMLKSVNLNGDVCKLSNLQPSSSTNLQRMSTSSQHLIQEDAAPVHPERVHDGILTRLNNNIVPSIIFGYSLDKISSTNSSVWKTLYDSLLKSLRVQVLRSLII